MIAAPGTWRLSFDVAHGSFETSHVAECPDIAPECATMFIAPHRHEVGLELTRYRVEARYGFREAMQLALSVPYDVKEMNVVYTTLDGRPFTPPYGDIHHRTETLKGLADATLSVEWQARPSLILGGGTTLPVGRIERDPVAAGRLGIEHEHIQFGTGTFQPRLTAQWLHPGRLALFARAEAKLGLYENREGFKPPTTITAAAGPSFHIGRISIDPRITGQYQTIGRWNGEVDEGTGVRNAGVTLQLAVPVRDAVIAPSVYRELWSHGLHHGEKFAQKWTFSLAVARSF
jgi:hypothetical protein